MIVVSVLTLTDDDNVRIFNNNNTQMSLLGIKEPFAIASTFSYAFKKRIGFDNDLFTLSFQSLCNEKPAANVGLQASVRDIWHTRPIAFNIKTNPCWKCKIVENRSQVAVLLIFIKFNFNTSNLSNLLLQKWDDSQQVDKTNQVGAVDDDGHWSMSTDLLSFADAHTQCIAVDWLEYILSDGSSAVSWWFLRSRV